ncbi:MAG: AhpC/TSA family protein [Leptolyngbya sp. SIOISBB]|nr:AhpC/TSA family protein [Leptolyngbya sp. SIOISBB]
MTLTQDLANLAAQNADRIPAAAQAVMAQAGADIAQLGIEDQSLKTGDRLPEFTLTNALGNPVAIADLLQQGPLVIAFYRGGWCPYCNLELRALQQALPAIKAEGAQLVAIAPETPDHSLSTQEKNELTFEVLSDIGNQVAREFGLVFTLPESLLPIYQSFGIDVAAHNGDENFELPVPATYVVTPEGKIVHHFVNVDYKQREDPEAILTVLKSLKVTA